MAGLKIGELAHQAGVTPHTLRYYEKIGLLPKPARLNGQRFYQSDVLPRLALIRFAQQAGFRLREIRDLLRNFSVDTAPALLWHDPAQRKLQEIDSIIAQYQAMKVLLEQSLRCGCGDFASCELLKH